MRAGWSRCWPGELMLWAGFLSHWRRRARQFGPLLQWKNDSCFTKGYCSLVPEALRVFGICLLAVGSKWKCERSHHGIFFFVCFGFFLSWGQNCSFSSDTGKFWVSARQIHTHSFETTLVKETTSASLGGGWAEGLERCVPCQGNVCISRLEYKSINSIFLALGKSTFPDWWCRIGRS